MGKNNKARRAAKARDRRQRASRRSGPARPGGVSGGSGDPLRFDAAELTAELLAFAPYRLASGDREFAAAAADRLAQLPRQVVERGVGAELCDTLAVAWRAGWQPAELVRQVRRRNGAAHVAMASTAVAVDHRSHPAPTIDPRWSEQVDQIAAHAADLSGSDAQPRRWFARWSAGNDLAAREQILVAIELLATIASLPHLEQLIPPPGGFTDRSGPEPAISSDLSDADRALLERVRNLLAKAEATEFEAEAETFTAKAHELITRHAIDAALLDAEAESTQGASPITIRIAVDDPYADVKSLLLQIVAEANRCRTVFHTHISTTSVIGFPADVRATELLYTSLLVQGQTALAAAGRDAPPGARTRSRGYRSAFLVAYANRIGQRLDEINAHLFNSDESDGHAALPVLRMRESTIDDEIRARYPELEQSPVRGGFDAAGWAGGRMAADQAQLSFADLDDASAQGAAQPGEAVALGA